MRITAAKAGPPEEPLVAGAETLEQGKRGSKPAAPLTPPRVSDTSFSTPLPEIHHLDVMFQSSPVLHGQPMAGSKTQVGRSSSVPLMRSGMNKDPAPTLAASLTSMKRLDSLPTANVPSQELSERAQRVHRAVMCGEQQSTDMEEKEW